MAVGILISAFYQPIWTSAILKPIDFAFVSILFSMLAFWKLPPWFIVVVGAVGGRLLGLFVIKLSLIMNTILRNEKWIHLEHGESMSVYFNRQTPLPQDNVLGFSFVS